MNARVTISLNSGSPINMRRKFARGMRNTRAGALVRTVARLPRLLNMVSSPLNMPGSTTDSRRSVPSSSTSMTSSVPERTMKKSMSRAPRW